MYLLRKSCKFLTLLIFGVFISSCADETDMADSLMVGLDSQQQNAMQLMASSRSGDPDGNDQELSDHESVDLWDDDCFEFVYPIEISFPDGSVSSISTEDDLEEILTIWFESNEDSTAVPSLVFPLSLMLDSLNVIVIQTEEELCDIIMECALEDIEDESSEDGDDNAEDGDDDDMDEEDEDDIDEEDDDDIDEDDDDKDDDDDESDSDKD